MTVIEYCTKFKRMWDQLLNYEPFPKCSYGAMKILSASHDKAYVMRFLMGLNENFETLRSQILIQSHQEPHTRSFVMWSTQDLHCSTRTFWKWFILQQLIPQTLKFGAVFCHYHLILGDMRNFPLQIVDLRSIALWKQILQFNPHFPCCFNQVYQFFIARPLPTGREYLSLINLFFCICICQ